MSDRTTIENDGTTYIQTIMMDKHDDVADEHKNIEPIDSGEMCGARVKKAEDTNIGMFICTRPPNHEGLHAAHVGTDLHGYRVAAVWNDEAARHPDPRIGWSE